MNNIPEGYKETEAGVIPGDWDVNSFKEIAEIDPDNLESSTDPAYVFKYITLEDVDNGVLRNITELIFKNAPSRARRKIRTDDILLSTVRPNLKSHFWVRDEIKDWVCSTGFSVIRCKKNIMHPGFIFNHLFSFIIGKQVDTLITGSNYPAINSNDVKSLKIPCPPTFSEQTAIANVLSDADDLISSLEKLIAKKRAIKQGAMEELLTGKKRLPRFSGKWKVKKLGKISFVTKLAGFEYTIHFDYSKSGEIIAIRALNIKNGQLNLNDIHTMPKHTSDLLKRSKLFKGDLALSYVGTLGQVAIIPEDDKYHLAPNVAKISVDRNKVNPFYLNQFLNSRKGQCEILKLAASTTQAALSMKNLREVLVFLPPTLPEQTAISAILSDMDSEIEALEQKLSKYRLLKQGLMEELLTGKTRLL